MRPWRFRRTYSFCSHGIRLGRACFCTGRQDRRSDACALLGFDSQSGRILRHGLLGLEVWQANRSHAGYSALGYGFTGRRGPTGSPRLIAVLLIYKPLTWAKFIAEELVSEDVI